MERQWSQGTGDAAPLGGLSGSKAESPGGARVRRGRLQLQQLPLGWTRAAGQGMVASSRDDTCWATLSVILWIYTYEEDNACDVHQGCGRGMRAGPDAPVHPQSHGFTTHCFTTGRGPYAHTGAYSHLQGLSRRELLHWALWGRPRRHLTVSVLDPRRPRRKGRGGGPCWGGCLTCASLCAGAKRDPAQTSSGVGNRKETVTEEAEGAACAMIPCTSITQTWGQEPTTPRTVISLPP